jgi:hypothetical protein
VFKLTHDLDFVHEPGEGFPGVEAALEALDGDEPVDIVVVSELDLTERALTQGFELLVTELALVRREAIRALATPG